ncbi:hypothetical protein FB45DRAFT_759167 [Roridomyces roridus]|uniref:DUF6589 domain-containing protein n=1 Tax=Roridomyces roridus TaxID=1738132 RepID=A0AAD7B8X8_9AGAR|nr:hypothetical protein FB45DRAFT_759167 [Roridomyces roridus]
MRKVHADRRAAGVLPVGLPAPSIHPQAALFDRILSTLRTNKSSFRGLFFYVMDPKFKQGKHRRHFLGLGDSVERALALIHRTSQDIRQRVASWAMGLVSGLMRKEARTLTASKLMQTHHLHMSGSFFSEFNFAGVKESIVKLMPTVTGIITGLASNPKYAPKHKRARNARRSNVIFSSILQLASEWSQSNNLFKKVMSLYMYATGAQRQQIEVLSHLGITQTYSSLVDKRKRKKRKKKHANSGTVTPTPTAPLADKDGVDDVAPTERKGTLHQLADDMKAACRALAETGLFGATYDNINIMSRVAEQIVGRKDSQENGTCATIFPLHKASVEDMKAETLTEAFDKAPPLHIQDIVHSESEASQFWSMIVHTILRIVILEGGDSFKQFREELLKRQPATEDKIDVHQTNVRPAPAWQIDQSTITGNAEFIEAFYKYLGILTSPTFSTWARLIIGDQLSIARLRSLLTIRAGQEGGARGFCNFVLIPGLFHAKIADTHGFFATHWGKPNTGNRVPGSLWYHNTLIHRLPITLTSLPPFRTCRDLIWVSLYARVLDCLLLVTGKKSVGDVVDKTTTFDELLGNATAIYERFVDADTVESLRAERAFAVDAGVDPAAAKKGDMVFENAVLFLRDALISREYADAVKCGDSGRVVLVLKTWALSYRGSGRSKYAYEMLSLIHNITHVWPKPMVQIVLNNWLVNTTGNPNSFLEGDLLQEHMNYWIKNYYRAHGSNSSWDWMEMLAPCVIVLRDLTRSLNGTLGADLGTKHKSPDHSKDVNVLMIRLNQYDVHKIVRGRVIDEDDGAPVTDIISAGLTDLTDATKNAIDEYNTTFRLLQQRCRLPVLNQGGSEPAAPLARLIASNVGAVDGNPGLAAVGGSSDVDTVMGDAAEETQQEDAEADREDLLDEEEALTLTLETADDVALEMDEMGLEDEDHDFEDDSSDDED